MAIVFSREPAWVAYLAGETPESAAGAVHVRVRAMARRISADRGTAADGDHHGAALGYRVDSK